MTQSAPEVVRQRAAAPDIVEVSDVTITFPTDVGEPFTAVKDCSLSVRRGEFLSIVGPSDCGKSTLLFSIDGLYALSGGEILIDGSPVRRRRPDLLPRFPYEVCYAKRDTIQKNHDVFIRYVKGFIKAEQFVNDPANRSEVIRISAKAMDLNESDTALAHDDTIKYFPADGKPTLAGMKLALDGVQKFGNIQGPDKVTDDELVDDSLVNEAITSAS